mmetsp:Transcript_87838/g.284350  ORF Transcript_87838/g.284350 Transcript_87838/m.284350 type:complete len:168 (-) Transcript_87838:98-601(-)
MSIFASLATGPYIIPTKLLLSITPPVFSPIHCILHGVTSTYMPMFLRLFVQAQLGGGYDNEDPRGQIARLSGKSPLFDRLNSAHINGLETLPIFAAAMLAGLHAGVDEERLSKLGTLWLALRGAFLAIYLTQNKRTSNLRSIIWLWSFALCCNLLREAAAKKVAKAS